MNYSYILLIASFIYFGTAFPGKDVIIKTNATPSYLSFIDEERLLLIDSFSKKGHIWSTQNRESEELPIEEKGYFTIQTITIISV